MTKIGRLLLSAMLVASILSPVKNATAGDIDKTKARQVGAYFMAAQFGNKAITAESLKQVYEISNSVRGIAALYVFNTADERGFVIVSGSDCAEPIVAYSTDGPFDPNNIPSNMLWWLNDQADPIAYAQNNNIEASAESREAWSELEEQRLPYFGQDSKGITQLVKSTWNQEPLYNNWCPMDAGGRCVTGCVATAMAQIIYYWKYPRNGKQTKSYYWNGQELRVAFGEQYYNYELMVDALDYSSPQSAIDEVAKLSYHCGVAVEMSYSSESSGAQSEKVPTALYKYFKYERDSLNMIDRSNNRYYNANSGNTPNAKDTLWVNDIKEQILMGRPVYYAGSDPSGGTHARHAFVCDGWNSVSRKLHFNWGWGGSGDAWCNAYNLRLNAPGYTFNSEHRALLGITPPQDTIDANSQVAIHNVENPFVEDIYPNPANSQITVSYRIEGYSNVEMPIYDATGREVRRIVLSPSSSHVTVKVDDLTPGIYICRLQGHSQKFIVK